MLPSRKRGGQPGNSNAVTHGRHSKPVRAARLAELQAAWADQKRRSDEWIKQIPPTDYDAICDGLRALAAKAESKE